MKKNKLYDFLIDKVENINLSSLSELKAITSNSKSVKKNFLFVAIKGPINDGHLFIEQAIKNGASLILVNNNFNIRKLIKKDKLINYNSDTLNNNEKIIRLKKGISTSELYFDLVNYFYNTPIKNINFTGVTGTNGKTSITYLIKKIFDECKYKNFVVGTLGCKLGKKMIHLSNTTPGVDELFNIFNTAHKKRFNYGIMEVSSHALDQNRINPNIFKGVIFTNLTLDHLDYHKNFKNYFNAKLKLFTAANQNKIGVINIDDKFGEKICEICKYKKIIKYGIENKNADINAINIKLSLKRTEFDVVIFKNKKIKIITELLGEHNIYNILAAIGLSYSYKISLNKIIQGIKKFKSVPGRLEKIYLNKRLFLIDYAHTPDALENVLKIINKLKTNRVITVFGCGGDRDKTKRPVMGNIAVRMSDIVIITSDNPRTEKSEEIVKDILKGIDKKNNKNYIIEIDRKKAIKKSFEISQENDIILIAGKGHEDYQILGTEKIHFSDREEVEKLRNYSAINA